MQETVGRNSYIQYAYQLPQGSWDPEQELRLSQGLLDLTSHAKPAPGNSSTGEIFPSSQHWDLY